MRSSPSPSGNGLFSLSCSASILSLSCGWGVGSRVAGGHRAATRSALEATPQPLRQSKDRGRSGPRTTCGTLHESSTTQQKLTRAGPQDLLDLKIGVSPIRGYPCGSMPIRHGVLVCVRLVPGFTILLRSDLFIVVTVGGVVSMALRVAARWPSATIDTPPPTARWLRIGGGAGRLNNPCCPGLWAVPLWVTGPVPLWALLL
jgi:hypothetical protein